MSSSPSPSAGSPAPHPAPHEGWGTGARVWLARHAEVHEEWEGRAYGDLDVPLSAAGEARTREMGRDFAAVPLDFVGSSPLERARRLGEEVARRRGAELVLEDGWREVHRGSWQGRDVVAVASAGAGREPFRTPRHALRG